MAKYTFRKLIQEIMEDQLPPDCKGKASYEEGYDYVSIELPRVLTSGEQSKLQTKMETFGYILS